MGQKSLQTRCALALSECLSYIINTRPFGPLTAALRALRKRKPQETQALAFLAVFVYATHATQL